MDLDARERNSGGLIGPSARDYGSEGNDRTRADTRLVLLRFFMTLLYLTIVNITIPNPGVLRTAWAAVFWLVEEVVLCFPFLCREDPPGPLFSARPIDRCAARRLLPSRRPSPCRGIYAG
jgi:hypothetical protein